MRDKDKWLPPFCSERLCACSNIRLVLALTRTHTDRYSCYVSRAASPSGGLYKQTYLASGEGRARACRSRFGAHLLLAEVHQANLLSRLPPDVIFGLIWEEKGVALPIFINVKGTLVLNVGSGRAACILQRCKHHSHSFPGFNHAL